MSKKLQDAQVTKSLNDVCLMFDALYDLNLGLCHHELSFVDKESHCL